MNWNNYEGKLLHVFVESVIPYGPEENKVSIRVLESDEYVDIRIDKGDER